MDNNTATAPVLKITIEGGHKTGKTSLAIAILDLLAAMHGNVQLIDTDDQTDVDHPLYRLSNIINNGVQFKIITVLSPQSV